jgi:DMSO/TMAO reductase YedYZ molybdopterin-dependent catalytic subunit
VREQQIRDSLPLHSSKDQKPFRVLQVDGLVERPLELTVADLERLPQQDFTGDFACLEGWTVPKVHWRGVSMETLLSLAKPHNEARFVQARAQEFSVSLSREDAARALLAIRLDDSPILPKQGGPIRLVVPDGKCFTQIKWLDHLELRSEPGANTAETIALNRLR